MSAQMTYKEWNEMQSHAIPQSLNLANNHAEA